MTIYYGHSASPDASRLDVTVFMWRRVVFGIFVTIFFVLKIFWFGFAFGGCVCCRCQCSLLALKTP